MSNKRRSLSGTSSPLLTVWWEAVNGCKGEMDWKLLRQMVEPVERDPHHNSQY